MSSLSLARLRAFCEVAEASSFTVAANRVFRTQPALSRQIGELEASLGLRLFERRGRSVVLTPAGEELHDRARQLLGDAGEFEARARALAQGHQGVLRAGFHPGLFGRCTSALLDAYAKQWPSITVKLSEGSAEKLARKVEAREIDFAFVRYMTSDSLVARRLFPMHVVAVVGPDHPLGQKETVEISALRDEELLLSSEDSGSRILVEQAFVEEGMRLGHIKLESSSPLGLLSLALAGQGVALMFSMSAVADAGTRVIPVTQNGRRLGMWSSVLWHRHAELGVYAQEFLQLASRHLQADFPGKQFGFPLLPADFGAEGGAADGFTPGAA